MTQTYLFCLLVVVITAGVLRFATIGTRSLSGDETISIYDARGIPGFNAGVVADRAVDSYGADHELLFSRQAIDWIAVLEAVRQNEYNPPLYFALLAAWINIVGAKQGPARMLSALFGVLSILAAALAASYLGGRRLAAITAALMTVMQFHINYSQDLRPYSLVMLISSLAIYLFSRAVSEGDWKWTVLLCICYASGFYSHYGFVILPMFQLIFTAVRPGNRDRLKFVVPALAGAGVLFVPWLPAMLDQMAFALTRHRPALSVAEVLRQGGWKLTSYWMGLYLYVPRSICLSLSLLLWGFALHCLIAAGRRGRNVELIAWQGVLPWIVPALAFVFLASKDLSIQRYYSALIPGMVIAVAWTTLAIRKMLSVIVWLMVLPAILWNTAGYYVHPTKIEFDSAVSFIQEHCQDDVLLVSTASPVQLSYYLSGYPNRVILTEWTPALSRNYRNVCLVLVESARIARADVAKVRNWLDANMIRVESASYHGVDVTLYRARQRRTTSPDKKAGAATGSP